MPELCWLIDCLSPPAEFKNGGRKSYPLQQVGKEGLEVLHSTAKHMVFDTIDATSSSF